jgi:CAAX prenyl protease-like protein
VERDFRRVALSQWQTGPFWVTAVLFGIEHDRWLVGILAGVVYGLLVLRSRNLGTAIWAHIVTNLALGLYVLAAGDYRFW